jgi:hypothetical protein
MTLAAVEAAVKAEDWIAGFAWLQAYLAIHPGIRLPKPGTLNIRVHGETRAEKVADLHEIASQWEAEVVPQPDGTLLAERWFGTAVRVEAHLGPDYAGTRGYLDAARARNARRGAAA